MTLPIQTNVRPTDIVADQAFSRLGNTGSALLDDLLNKIHQYFGRPFEFFPTTTPSASIDYSAGVYTLPDGVRLAPVKGNKMPTILPGQINFDLGTVSTGGVSSFVVPSMTAGNYIRALIGFNFSNDGMTATFGSQNASLSLCSIPLPLADYEPLCVIELHSTAGGSGVGTFDPISKSSIIYLIDTLDNEAEPVEEVITVTGSPMAVFNLTTVIPSQRMRLSVFVNGVKYIYGVHYTVSTDTQVVFNEAVSVNAEVTFRVE